MRNTNKHGTRPMCRPALSGRIPIIVIVAVLCLTVLSSGCLKSESGSSNALNGQEDLADGSLSNGTMDDGPVQVYSESGVMIVGVLGIGIQATYTWTFPVEEGAVGVRVVCDGSNGSMGRGDIDMSMTSPDGAYIAGSGSPGSYETVELDTKDIVKRWKYGHYSVELIEYSGAMLDFTLNAYVMYSDSNSTSSEE